MHDDQISKLKIDIQSIKEKLEELELRIMSGEEFNNHREDNRFEMFDVVFEQLGILFDRLGPLWQRVFPEDPPPGSGKEKLGYKRPSRH